MANEKKILTVVIPVFNEKDCIDELIMRLNKMRTKLDDVDMHCLFVDDGSYDETHDILFEYSKKYSFLKILKLSRNFGHQIAITAGLDNTNSDYTIIMDADLQDPPELIFDLYNKAVEGYDIVYANRIDREGESYFKKKTAQLFYYLMGKLCDIDLPSNTGDFRLINHKVIAELKQMRERHRFIRGMIPWIGFKSTAIQYTRNKRFAGETKYPLRRMMRLAIDAIFSFSYTPLRFATYIGILAVFIGIIGGSIILYIRLFTSYAPSGAGTTIILMIIFMGGIQIIMIGIIGEYIGKIFEEVKDRPLYIVDSKVNIVDESIIK